MKYLVVTPFLTTIIKYRLVIVHYSLANLEALQSATAELTKQFLCVKLFINSSN